MQLSKIWSIYGVVTLFSYILGGYFTDRFSPKKIIVTALCASGILHFYLSFVPGYPSVLTVSAMMGLTTVFAFFPAASKILSTMDDEKNTGGIFGIYYACEGIGNTILNLAGTGLYMLTENERMTFVWMMRSYTVLNLVSAVLIFIFLKETAVTENGQKVSILQLKQIIKKKEVWKIAMTTLSTYVMFCSLTYLNSYLKEIYQIPEGINLLLAVIRVDIIAIIAGVIFGKLCNFKGSVSYVVQKGLIGIGICVILILINQFTIHSMGLAVLLTTLFSFMGIGSKTVSIAMIAQQKFPVSMTGSVIGLVSFIGYSPDTFLYPVVGKMLMVFGSGGYFYMFGFFFVISVIGAVCANT